VETKKVKMVVKDLISADNQRRRSAATYLRRGVSFYSSLLCRSFSFQNETVTKYLTWSTFDKVRPTVYTNKELPFIAASVQQYDDLL